jgi:hypothetical protein
MILFGAKIMSSIRVENVRTSRCNIYALNGWIWKKLAIADDNECLVWQGKGQKDRVAKIKIDGSTYIVRRLLVQTSNREQVESRCGNGLCINPDHLIVRVLDHTIPGVKALPQIPGSFRVR